MRYLINIPGQTQTVIIADGFSREGTLKSTIVFTRQGETVFVGVLPAGGWVCIEGEDHPGLMMRA